MRGVWSHLHSHESFVEKLCYSAQLEVSVKNILADCPSWLHLYVTSSLGRPSWSVGATSQFVIKEYRDSWGVHAIEALYGRAHM